MVKKLIDIPPTEFKGMYSKQPQKCYPKDYIETLEQSELFTELKMKAAGRQAAMKAVADAKRAENIATHKNKRSIKVRYKKISESRFFKEAYEGKSIGETMEIKE